MATALVRPDSLYAWAGESLLVVNTRGECADDQSLTGYYFRETRFLRTLQFRVNGGAPWRCEAASVEPDALAFTYVHPELTQTGEQAASDTDEADLPERALDIRMDLAVTTSMLDARVAVTNRSTRPVTFTVSWILAADFADIQEAESARRQQRARVGTTVEDAELRFDYRHPQLPFVVRLQPVDHLPWRLHRHGMDLDLRLEPQQRADLALRVLPSGTGRDLAEGDVAARTAVLDEWRHTFTRVEIPGNRVAEQIVGHNVRDVGSFPLLDGEPDEWLTLQAGMPAYPSLFGRDALTAGWQAAIIDRGRALAAALNRLGRLQSQRFDDWHDEEPGRIPYQVRRGPLELLNKNPDAAYYADFASPLMYVISLANLYAWTGDRSVVDRHWDTARRILDWAREYGDRDHDGYLEYQTKSKKGTKNQGWKDSDDAIIYDDGTLVPDPLATCEIQGYWYAAQQLMGAMAWMRGERDDAKAHRDSAADLKMRFNRDWWMPDRNFFALAMDPDKRLVRALTSNVGHCLGTGIIDSHHLRATVDRLFAPDLFSGWGIRTLSANHAFYNPLSYHRGTVWGVEQGTIAFGLRRFGFTERAQELSQAMFDLAMLYPQHRIPECVGGYARDERPTPGAYPHANTPQLWNASAFPLIMQMLLGILPLAPFSTLVLDPVLPSWLPDVTLHGLRVGEATVSLRFMRDNHGRSHYAVLEKRGTLHIVRQPPPEAVDAGLAERLLDVVESSLHA